MKQNDQFTRIFNNIADNFEDKEIHSYDMDYFKNLINKNTLRILLKEILNDDYLLEKIANRSYTHALGFDKIVLIDLQKDLGIKN